MAYDASSIDVPGDLGGIRSSPGMYIGIANSHGIFQLIKEAADNSVDEFMQGRCDHITVAYDGEFFYIHDNGPGIPVDQHPEEKVSALNLVCTKLHAGGKSKGNKSDNKAYSATIGTHGVGLKATNALSAVFRAYSLRKKKWWGIHFESGRLIQDVQKDELPNLPEGLEPESGTLIIFKPDYEIFAQSARFNPEHLYEWADLTTYLNGGLRVTYIDKTGKKHEWYRERGIEDYLDMRLQQLGIEDYSEPVVIREGALDVVATFTGHDDVAIESYCNSSRTQDGGDHLNSFWSAVYDSLVEKSLKSHKFNNVDIREGVVGLINVKVESPQFSSQTKEKLADDRVRKPVYDAVLDNLRKYWKKNPDLARNICDRATEIHRVKSEYQFNKKIRSQLNTKKKTYSLPTKLSPSTGSTPQKRELFLVEGDSAGKTAKYARNRSYQEVLPQKGKLLNAYSRKQGDVFNSAETLNVLLSMGFDPDSYDEPLDHLRVGRIILLADPDPDGYHINALNLALFARYMPGIFDRGMVYIVQVPEYRIYYKGEYYYGDSVEEVRDKVPKGAKNMQVGHIKGWGEIEEDELELLAFNPNTRHLLKVSAASEHDLKGFAELMGGDSSVRRQLILEEQE